MSELVFICDAKDLEERGTGVRFPVTAWARDATGFVVRYQGQLYGYLNRCAHMSIELDWNQGQFFDGTGLHLMCSTHGAIYFPDTGKCAGGPCRGGRLHPIAVVETQGKIFWCPDDDVRPAVA